MGFRPATGKLASLPRTARVIGRIYLKRRRLSLLSTVACRCHPLGVFQAEVDPTLGDRKWFPGLIAGRKEAFRAAVDLFV
jgi:hypothetical protein